ncbi:MAG: GTP cyclohydrolase I FolE [Pirellulaceae bacterium]
MIGVSSMSAQIDVSPSLLPSSADRRRSRRRRLQPTSPTSTARRPDGPVDGEAIEEAVRTILNAVGEDPDRPGLRDTPRRVARMYAEMFSGLHVDPARHLHVTFPENYDEMVIVRDIPFTSMCEHHLLPFSGVAHVAYIPDGRVTGLSKLARVVEEVSRRPQVQERMTHTIADLLEKELGSNGVAVVIQAEHSCMSIRGVRKPGTSTVTSALRGTLKTNPASRAEALALINHRSK